MNAGGRASYVMCLIFRRRRRSASVPGTSAILGSQRTSADILSVALGLFIVMLAVVYDRVLYGVKYTALLHS